VGGQITAPTLARLTGCVGAPDFLGRSLIMRTQKHMGITGVWFSVERRCTIN